MCINRRTENSVGKKKLPNDECVQVKIHMEVRFVLKIENTRQSVFYSLFFLHGQRNIILTIL